MKYFKLNEINSNFYNYSLQNNNFFKDCNKSCNKCCNNELQKKYNDMFITCKVYCNNKCGSLHYTHVNKKIK